MDSPGSQLLVCLGGMLFGGWNLYQGLSTGKTWHPSAQAMDRNKTPWNYRVAILGWAFGTLAGGIGCADAWIRLTKG
jgi:hypothetical protein